MRNPIMTALAAFVAGGLATGAALSFAQQAPGPHPGAPMMAGDHPDGGAPWMRHHGMMHRMRGGPVSGLRAFALVYRQQDRNLTPADVQKIAEAFLLFNGNHSWKVTDVAATTDGKIGFSMATAEGSVIAKFTMDPHTARLTRVG
jgi:hypothetical protein